MGMMGKIDCTCCAYDRQKRKELLHYLLCINTGVIGVSGMCFYMFVEKIPRDEISYQGLKIKKYC
jgi:hypothetical protein